MADTPRAGHRKRVLASWVALALAAGLVAIVLADAGASTVPGLLPKPTAVPPPPAPTVPPIPTVALGAPPPLPQPPLPTGVPSLKDELRTIPVPGPTLEAPLALPTRSGVTPAPSVATYRDPIFGFSFSYPSNWSLDVPSLPPTPTSVATVPNQRTITLRNYNNVVKKRGMTPDELRIDISVQRGFATHIDLQDWVARNVVFAPGTVYSQMQQVVVAGSPGLRWGAQGPTLPLGGGLVAVGRGDLAYVFHAFPANSQHLPVLDQVLQSFRFS